MKKVTIIEATSRDDITGDRERLRVAAYARVSTEEDEQKTASPLSGSILKGFSLIIPNGSMPGFIMTRV